MMNALWLRLRFVLLLWACFASTTFAPPSIFAYDAENQTIVAYYSNGESAGGYDPASVPTTGEKKKGTPGDCVSFSKFAEFFAAERTGTRLLPAYTGYQPWAGEIRSVTAASDTTMYRVWGGGSRQAGPWLSPIRPTSAASAIESLALPSANTAQFYSEVLVPGGTRYQIGTAAGANGLTGGGVQVQLLEQIPNANFGPGIPLRP